MSDNPYRQIPSVSKLLEHPALAAARNGAPHEVFAEAVRIEVDALRQRIGTAGETFDENTFLEAIRYRLQNLSRLKYSPVINATGIVLHTNLGRSPMAESAAKAAYDAARGYLALEFDLATGERGNRQGPIRDAICRLTGAESATVVNNCAAATVITLRTLAAGKEVIVSRGQLIEIGGSFRIPEIMGVSGATLREVGTTNITRLKDYEAAIGPNTAALMRVHCSNYRVRGFTDSVSIEDLVSLGKQHNLPVIDDIGSGAALQFPDEPTVRDGLAAGADLVLFSGDKLLGGPQAGILAGKTKWIDAIERDPLMRAVRLDKMMLAALGATLALYRDPATINQTIPTLRMLSMPLSELRGRSERFAERLKSHPEITVEILNDVAYAGGGSLPDQTIPTVVIVIHSKNQSEESIAERLRLSTPPVVARIHNNRIQFDLRTVFAEQEQMLLDAILTTSL